MQVNLINAVGTTQMLTNREVGEFAKFHAKPGRRIISIHDRNTQVNQPNYLMRQDFYLFIYLFILVYMKDVLVNYIHAIHHSVLTHCNDP